VRTGSTAKIFINGVGQTLNGSVPFNSNDVGNLQAKLKIGGYGADGSEVYFLHGRMDEFRISKGIARWISDFTPPASAYGETVPPSSVTSAHMLNYQGRLTNPSGAPVADGQYSISFKIYDAESAGILLWEETQTVSITKGIFNVLLGAVNNTLATKLPAAEPYYLEIKVGTEVMTPRQRIASAVSALNGVPRGGIIMWSGTISDIPAGWALCNGSNGTPDLRDRFIVGARQDESGTAKSNLTGSLTKNGGSTVLSGFTGNHTLTVDEIPAHTHSFGQQGFQLSAPGSAATIDGTGTRQVSNSTGGGSAHNHPAEILPYYAVAFIMKL
jgi:hypothetical protein